MAHDLPGLPKRHRHLVIACLVCDSRFSAREIRADGIQHLGFTESTSKQVRVSLRLTQQFPAEPASSGRTEELFSDDIPIEPGYIPALAAGPGADALSGGVLS